MMTPGLVFLGRFALLSLTPCIICSWLIQLIAPHGMPFAHLLTIGLVAVLPFGFVLRLVSCSLLRTREAASMGARQVPAVKGKLFGNLDVLFRFLERSNPFDAYPGDRLSEFIAAYGHCHRYSVMFQDQLFTCEPEHIKAMLATDFSNFVKGDKLRKMTSTVLGTGVFTADGDMWKFHRTMTRPFFSQSRIGHFDIFDRHADQVINLIKCRVRANRPIDFQDLMFRFTLDSATEFLFGHCVHSLSADLPLPYAGTPTKPRKVCVPLDFTSAFAQAQFVTSRRPFKGWAWPMFEIFRDETEEPMKVVNASIEPVLREAMKKHKLTIKRGEPGAKKPLDEETLLDNLVGQTTEHKILKDEILTIMVAARDTTSAALTFAVYMLATHPLVFTRLREEIMQRVGPTNPPGIEDIRELEYLRAVVDETLRLYAPVPFNKLESVRATTFPSSDPSEKPYYVPGDTSVWYSLSVMHRRKDLWGPDAEEFDPDRFLDDRLHKYLTPRPSIFMPFSAGPRMCLGQQFAYNEISFTLIRLLQNFTSISLAPEAHTPETLPPAAWANAEGRKAKEKVMPDAHLIMHIRGGLWVRMTEADNKDL